MIQLSQRDLRATLVLAILGSACLFGDDPPLHGALAIQTLDNNGVVFVEFTATAGSYEPGSMFLEFTSPDAPLLLDGSTGADSGCIALPSSEQVQILVEDGTIATGSRIRVAVWYAPLEVPDEESADAMEDVDDTIPRCGQGVFIADAVWSGGDSTETSTLTQ